DETPGTYTLSLHDALPISSFMPAKSLSISLSQIWAVSSLSLDEPCASRYFSIFARMLRVCPCTSSSGLSAVRPLRNRVPLYLTTRLMRLLVSKRSIDDIVYSCEKIRIQNWWHKPVRIV